MNFNYYTIFYCTFASWFITFATHIAARYLVNTPIFPRIETETHPILQKLFGLKQTMRLTAYNHAVAAVIYVFFMQFFYVITPTLSIEQACALTLFYITIAITIITDFYTYLISTLVTLYLVPAVLFYAYKGYLGISLYESIITALIVGFSMYAINYIYTTRKGTPAFGEGDRDLLIYIATFMGGFPTLFIIFYASLIGSLWGIIALITKRHISFCSYTLPFGTCLGFGAFIHQFISFFYGPTWLSYLS